MLTRSIKQTQNPQDWLPVGQRVNVTQGYRPHTYNETGERVYYMTAIVVEHLNGGMVALEFDGYKGHTLDYSAREAMQFTPTRVPTSDSVVRDWSRPLIASYLVEAAAYT